MARMVGSDQAWRARKTEVKSGRALWALREQFGLGSMMRKII